MTLSGEDIMICGDVRKSAVPKAHRNTATTAPTVTLNVIRLIMHLVNQKRM